jgi:hypothetical protein
MINRLPGIGIAFCIIVGCCRAQSVASVSSTVAATPSLGVNLISSASSADDAWGKFVNLSTRRLNQKEENSTSIEALSQKEQFLQSSFAAKAFYTAYPNDVRVPLAKKLEVILALQDVQVGDEDYKSTALALGVSYRSDKSNSAKDRFHVAMAMEAITLAPTLQGKQLHEDGTAYEKLADDLYDEFGGTDDVYSVYISIIRTCDATDSSRVANKILEMKGVPTWMKGEAQAVLARQALIGKIVDLNLTSIEGQKVTLPNSASVPTVVYFWNNVAGDGQDLKYLGSIQSAVPSSVSWVYVACGGGAAPSAHIKSLAPFSGTHCFERSQFGGNASTALKVSQTPYAYVIGSDGKLVGYGTVTAIPSLLQAAH